MFNIPDHPDIESAMRTGYPRSYHTPGHCVDEDWEYENRRDEALLAGLYHETDDIQKAKQAYTEKMIRELERRDHEAQQRKLLQS